MTRELRRLGSTDLEVSALCLGTNVFGWTADEASSFAVLDDYLSWGGNFLDTADVYSAWVPGHAGGESETIIGRWLASRGARDAIVLGTKVGGAGGLGRANILRRVEGSLRRLGTDRVDLLFAHFDDEQTPLAESTAAFDELVRAGKVRHVAVSNYGVGRIAEALAVADGHGLARFVAVQPLYNLMERAAFEGPLAELCEREGLAVLPYYGLARGFLTGKYRDRAAVPQGARTPGASAYLTPRGDAVLAAMDEVAAAHGAVLASVALAWLAAQPGVLAPLASARTPEQLVDILAAFDLRLSAGEVDLLSRSAEPVA